MISINGKQYYSTIEAAKFIGVSRHSVGFWVKYGLLKHDRGTPNNRGNGDIFIESEYLKRFKAYRDKQIEEYGRFRWNKEEVKIV